MDKQLSVNEVSQRGAILGNRHMISAGHYLAAHAGFEVLEDKTFPPTRAQLSHRILQPRSLGHPEEQLQLEKIVSPTGTADHTPFVLGHTLTTVEALTGGTSSHRFPIQVLKTFRMCEGSRHHYSLIFRSTSC